MTDIEIANEKIRSLTFIRTGVETTPEHVAYLDDLRESGEVNMMGAGSYIVDEFGVDHYTAKQIILSWMREKQGDVS